ncbi:hypothetical protein MP638_000540 [Amoeboaphelidium occidentale]|nr:hypothetical protein MP638_000540 [Amoeboaphelidium occidentale]
MKLSYTVLLLAALACSSYAVPTGKREAETSASVEEPPKKIKTGEPSTARLPANPSEQEESEFEFPELSQVENSETDPWRDFPAFDSLEDIFTPDELKELHAKQISDEEIDEMVRQYLADFKVSPPKEESNENDWKNAKFPEVPENIDLHKLDLGAGQVAAEFAPKPGEKSFTPAKPTDSSESSTAAEDLRETAEQQYREWSEEAE